MGVHSKMRQTLKHSIFLTFKLWMSDGFKLFTGQEDKIYIYDYPFTYLKKS